jgi:hypothetical protein
MGMGFGITLKGMFAGHFRFWAIFATLVAPAGKHYKNRHKKN